MNDLQRLVARDEIRQLAYRYALATDSRGLRRPDAPGGFEVARHLDVAHDPVRRRHRAARVAQPE